MPFFKLTDKLDIRLAHDLLSSWRLAWVLRAVKHVDGSRSRLRGYQIRILRHVPSAIDFVLVRDPLSDLNTRRVGITPVAPEL